MANIQLRIADRFPHYRELILRACNGDASIAELCLDYDSIVEEIEALESNPQPAGSHDRDHQELLKLANQLEKELLGRLNQVFTHDRNAST